MRDLPRTFPLAFLLFLGAASLGGCGRSGDGAAPEAPGRAEPKQAARKPASAAGGGAAAGIDAEAEAAATERARAAIGELKKTLKGRLQAAMQEGGPKAAIEVCASEAQRLTARVAEERGVKVGRSSLRLRNPANRAPEWVQRWLQAQGERKVEGVRGFARVEWGEARVLEPLGVMPLCVTCHGPREQLAPEVRELLQARYPEDRAVGYRPGDLRGAVWAAAPVRAAP